MLRVANALGLAAVTVLVAVAGVAPSAAADRATAMALCRAGVGGNVFNTNLTVPARSSAHFGHPTNIWPGDVVRITATGGIKTDEWPWSPFHSPAGIPEAAPQHWSWPAPGLRKFSLVASFNATGQQIPVGLDSGCIPYDGPPTFLWLQINDDWRLDNSGQWEAVIRVFA